MAISLDKMLMELVKVEGSDLHIEVGMVPKIRVEGQIKNLEVLPPNELEVENMIEEMNIDPIYWGRLYDDKSTDFRYESKTIGKFRTSIVMSDRGKKITMRNLNRKIPSLTELGYEEGLFDDVMNLRQGLVLLTGSTNSGKTTTMASLVQELLKRENLNIVTYEDPIEYFYDKLNKSSVVTQRELGRHFLDYPTGIKDSMRMDPDVIILGEMRDVDTIRGAVLLSETGHLVISSLHTNDVESSNNRMLLVFQQEERPLIETILKSSLKFIVSQELNFNPETEKLELKYEYKKYY